MTNEEAIALLKKVREEFAKIHKHMADILSNLKTDGS